MPYPKTPRVKTPRPQRSFAPGPALADGTALLEWFEADARAGSGPAYVRVPVVVFAGDLGGARLAYIGTDPAPPADDAIVLDLDDSALGIDLSTRLRSLCGTEHHAGAPSRRDACVVWIEGTWGRHLPSLVPGGEDKPPPWPLTVRDAGPLVEGSPATILVAASEQS